MVAITSRHTTLGATRTLSICDTDIGGSETWTETVVYDEQFIERYDYSAAEDQADDELELIDDEPINCSQSASPLLPLLIARIDQWDYG